MINDWNELKFWDEDWPAARDKLDKLHSVNPKRENLFRAMDICPIQKTKVAIIGQDPYPNPDHATGVAFSIPPTVTKFPPTLVCLLQEYRDDLHYPSPTSGNLEAWCSEGVFLWNTVPSCEPWRSLSHYSWDEWDRLTQEIITALNEQGVVFAFLGSVARRNAHLVRDVTDTFPEEQRKKGARQNKGIVQVRKEDKSGVIELHHPYQNAIELSHPSPRGSRASRNPFIGSRMFSTINDLLRRQGLKPVDWRL